MKIKILLLFVLTCMFVSCDNSTTPDKPDNKFPAPAWVEFSGRQEEGEHRRISWAPVPNATNYMLYIKRTDTEQIESLGIAEIKGQLYTSFTYEEAENFSIHSYGGYSCRAGISAISVEGKHSDITWSDFGSI